MLEISRQLFAEPAQALHNSQPTPIRQPVLLFTKAMLTINRNTYC
jgi:hypothetical protein